jgi:hypothetical protein
VAIEPERPTLRTVGRIFLAFTTAFAGMLLLTSPAHAIDERQCSGTQHREFSTHGEDVDLYVDLCVWRTGSRYDAEATGEWFDGGGVRKFDAFRLEVRLEKNDAAITYNSCNYVDAVNDREHSGYQCGTASHTGSGNGWTADGTLLFDYDGDGNGEYFWDLKGSGAI